MLDEIPDLILELINSNLRFSVWLDSLIHACMQFCMNNAGTMVNKRCVNVINQMSLYKVCSAYTLESLTIPLESLFASEMP